MTKRTTLASLMLAGAVLMSLVSCANPSGGSALPEESAGQNAEASKEVPAEPELTPEQELEQRANEIVASFSTREKIASVIMAYYPGTDIQAIADFASESGVGGLILMGSNIAGTEEDLIQMTAQISGEATYPRLIGIDEEGGAVTRLWWDTFAGAQTLKYEPPSASAEAFSGRAELLNEDGININFGIVADVTDNPYDFIYERSLGETYAEAAERVAVIVEAEKGLVYSTIKHFPGHGAAPGDSHWSLPTSEISLADWRGSHALPFEAGIAAGSELVMFGHLVFSAIDAEPASLSAEWHRILREELGFQGVTVTDDLAMLTQTGIEEFQSIESVAVRALKAGNDLLLFVATESTEQIFSIIDALENALETGEIKADRLDEAALRVTKLRLNASDF